MYVYVIGALRSARGSLKGTAQMVYRGGVCGCYSFTLTNHTTYAMHEHAVAITQLIRLGWSALLRAVLQCYSARVRRSTAAVLHEGATSRIGHHTGI